MMIFIMISSTAVYADFSDISDSRTNSAVNLLETLGIIDGYPDGGFHPEDLLTRAQFCKLAVLATGDTSSLANYSYITLYNDVTSSHWALPYINSATSKGYIAGYGNGYFGPEDNISYSQAITIMLRILGYTTSDIGNYWPEDYLIFAENIGLDADLGLGANKLLNRGETAILLYEMLNTNRKNGSPLYSELTSDSVTAILLDNDCVSDTGISGCAKFYVMSSATTGMGNQNNSTNNNSTGIKYYTQSSKLSADLIGSKGALLSEDGEVVGFIAGDETYTLADGILLSSNASNGVYSGCAKIYTGSGIAYYPQKTSVQNASVGKSGTLIIDSTGYSIAFVSDSDVSYTITENAVLLSANATSTTGDMGCAKFYTNGNTKFYKQYTSLWIYQTGSTGTLITDSSDYVYAFVVDGEQYTVINGVLLDTNTTPNEYYATSDYLMFMYGTSVTYYKQAGSFNSNQIGKSGTLLLNSNYYAVAFIADTNSTTSYSTLSNVYLLTTSELRDNGISKRAVVFDGSRISYYDSSLANINNVSYGSALVSNGSIISFKSETPESFSGYMNDTDVAQSENGLWLYLGTNKVRTSSNITVVYKNAYDVYTTGSWSNLYTGVYNSDALVHAFFNNGDLKFILVEGTLGAIQSSQNGSQFPGSSDQNGSTGSGTGSENQDSDSSGSDSNTEITPPSEDTTPTVPGGDTSSQLSPELGI